MRRDHKRFLSFLLAFVMVIGMMPASALAAEADTPAAAYAKVRSDDSLAALDDCLYTFALQSDGSWHITSETADGTPIYLDPHFRVVGSNTAGYPGRVGEAAVTLEDGYGEHAVKLHDSTGYLHVHTEKSASEATWNQCGSDEANNKHDVLLYRPAAEGENSSAEIPGYVLVEADVSGGNVTGIRSGDRLLVVGLHQDGSRSVMHPSSSTSSKEEHIAVLVTGKAVTGVSLDKTEATMPLAGDPLTLTAAVEPADALNSAIVWSSSDEAVATIDKGIVTAVGPGSADITVTTAEGGFTASCTVTVEDVEIEASEVDRGLTVTARYMTNRLSWNAESGAAYHVERSADGHDWEQIGTAYTGAYLDETADMGTRYYYRVTTATTYTAGVQGETTGMAALKKTAVLFYPGNDEIAFNGTNKVPIAEGDDAAKLNAMDSGTILYKAYFNSVSGKQAVLGTNNGLFVGTDGNKFRHELGSGFSGSSTTANMTAGADNTGGFLYDDSNGHWALCSNGSAVTALDLDETKFGLLTAANASTYYAGGSSAQTFSGTINYILILSEVLTDTELKTLTALNLDHDEDASMPLGVNIGQMFETAGADDRSNSWMFDGGSTTVGSVTEIGGIRNYAYQFEEYVRGIKMNALGDGWNSRQRFVIIVGKAGQTLAQSLDKFDDRADALDPRAAVYLVGAEDYEAGSDGIDAFKDDLRAYITNAVALRGDNGFAVIQTPYPNSASKNDELYAEAAREVVNGLTGRERSCTVLVDHNDDAFGAECYNEDGSLSGMGHYEMGRQLSAATFGSSSDYQTVAELTEAPAPASYSDVIPTVTSADNALTISGLEDIAWNVEIALESYTLTRSAVGSTLTFEDLPAGEHYTLTITAADLSVRMPIMSGTVNGTAQVWAPQRDDNQQAIAELLEADEPLTWLFMGDSITHGAKYTFGRDSISQMFEKFLKDDLHRVDDIVINTAVSSADTNDTITELEARLTRYQPDVVSIMIGTNDSATHINVGEAKYKQNLHTIIAAIQDKGAKVILRTPVPTKDGTRPEIGNYANWMGDVAAEYDDVILVEQYDSMGDLFAAAPCMIPILFNSGDYLHPTTEGQLWMLERFLEETGMSHDGYLANLRYESGTATDISHAAIPVNFADGTATLDTSALQTLCGEALYTVKLMATDTKGAVYSAEGTVGETLTMKNLPNDVTFTAEAQLANRNAVMKFGVPDVIEVEVYVDRQQVVTLEGTVTPNASGVEGIATVAYRTEIMAGIGNTNTFSEGYEPLANNLYTFDRQDNGTWLISAEVDGTPLYIDPHAGAGNGGRPSRDYKTFITLEDGTDGAVKLHELSGGYLHFWDNDDSKLYWDQCTADGGHTGHHLLIYRPANENEASSQEVPGFVQVNSVSGIADGGQYLIVGKANSGGYYALRPSLSTGKYQHLCKVAGPITELTITGLREGTGTILAGSYILEVSVLAPSEVTIELDYNYPGAPENGTVKVVSGDPIGDKLPVPMRDGYTFFGWYLSGTKVTSSYVVTEAVTLTADWVTVPTKEKPANGTTTNGQPFPVTDANGAAYCYRIPGIVTLADGTVVAMADQRWNTYIDCGGLDTILSVSKDNGKTWEYTYANYLGDNGDRYYTYSTTFIDPAIATDGKTVYMIADLFPAGVSTWAAGYASQAGSGGFNAKGYLMLRDLVGDTYKIGDDSVKSAYIAMATSRSYDFYLFPEDDGTYTIRRVSDDTVVEGYSVDAMLNVTSADGSVNTHLFKADSPYQVYPTNYLYLTTSEDGLNWSAPQLINAKTATESAFLIGPGSGTYDPIHNNMVFTAYSYSGSASSQKTSLLWAGEDGVWHRSEPATTDVWSSEAAAVVLENGTVRVFYRSGSTVLCYTDYLWVDGEYVRDVNNTSVSTEAVKNSGNGCMLSAVGYPQKVNGKEVIFVATPATANSRSDGHIYAFFVNKDGSMELAADYDITPYASEYYAYSCLTVLTQGEEAGDLALFWENTWTSSPASCTIRYDVIPIEDVLAGVREVVRKDVSLTVGEKASFEDPEGYYVGADTSDLDPAVAAVEITGTVTKTVLAAAQAVSELESGKQYIIVNTRAEKPMTNEAASSAAAAGAGSGLSLTGTKENVPESALWIIETATGGYTVKDANGKHLTITSNGAGVTDAESVVNIARNGNTWTISQNGAYLNDFGGSGTCAAGWQHSTAATDPGSQWSIYTVEEVPVEGTSVITFTGVGAGETQVQIGYVLYHITVTEAACAHTPGEAVRENEKAATCTEDGSYESVVYCSVCGEEVSRETVTVPAAGHTEEIIPAVDATCTEDGLTEGKKCSVCGEILVAQEVVPALGHTFGEWTVTTEPTCTEAGIETRTCECGEAEARVVEALGHDFVNGDCTRCDAVKDAPFEDVLPGEFYFDPVEWAVEQGITKGATETTFNPDGDLQRAQFVTMLWRAAGEPKPTTTENPFEDVKKTDFFYEAVLWAVEEGITNGSDASHFNPYGVTNRAHAVTFLWRYLGEPEAAGTNSFTDVEPGLWYEAPINWAVGAGVTNGMSETQFGIDLNCNRAHAVTFLYRALAN